MLEYGQETPPAYDLKSIQNMPIAIFSGVQDVMTSKGDYDWLSEMLKE